jgi:hypothetical protein
MKLDSSSNARFEIRSQIPMVEEQFKYEQEAKQEIRKPGSTVKCRV